MANMGRNSRALSVSKWPQHVPVLLERRVTGRTLPRKANVFLRMNLYTHTERERYVYYTRTHLTLTNQLHEQQERERKRPRMKTRTLPGAVTGPCGNDHHCGDGIPPLPPLSCLIHEE